jgi:hypothetical protein
MEMLRRRAGGAEEAGDEENNGRGFGGLVVSEISGVATRAALYILEGMRLLRIALGTLALLLFLALVCCILSSIFVSLDLKSDLSISVQFVEDDGDQPPLVDGEGGDTEPTCSDGNPCTADYQFDSGGCESIPYPEGTPCEDVCFSSPGTCEYVEVQKGVTKPICANHTVRACRGECGGGQSCPDLIPAEQICEPACPEPLCNEDLVRSDDDDPYCQDASSIGEKCYFAPPIEKFCGVTTADTCIYRARLPYGIFNFDGQIGDFSEDDIQPVIDTEDVPEMGCRVESEFFRNYCMGLISDDDPYKSCLVPIVECKFQYLNQDLTNPDQRQGDPFHVPQCYYHFGCISQPFLLALD